MTILIRITDSSNNRDMNNLNRSICLVESIFDPYNHHTKIQLHLKKKKSRFYINYFSNIVFHLHNFSRKIKKKKLHNVGKILLLKPTVHPLLPRPRPITDKSSIICGVDRKREERPRYIEAPSH